MGNLKIWDLFPKLTRTVLDTHELCMMYNGHPFDHTLNVAQTALFIADNELIGRLAGAAGLCHNADRILQKQLGIGRKDVPADKVTDLVLDWLEMSDEFTGQEEDRILAAVQLHSGPNLDDGDEVLVALQDADRIVCASASEFMAAGQFRPDIPVIDTTHIADEFGDPDFKSPKCVARDLLSRKDWIDPASKVCVRLPKALELMKSRVAFTMAYLEMIKSQRAEVGLWPDYPKF